MLILLQDGFLQRQTENVICVHSCMYRRVVLVCVCVRLCTRASDWNGYTFYLVLPKRLDMRNRHKLKTVNESTIKAMSP